MYLDINEVKGTKVEDPALQAELDRLVAEGVIQKPDINKNNMDYSKVNEIKKPNNNFLKSNIAPEGPIPPVPPLGSGDSIKGAKKRKFKLVEYLLSSQVNDNLKNTLLSLYNKYGDLEVSVNDAKTIRVTTLSSWEKNTNGVKNMVYKTHEEVGSFLIDVNSGEILSKEKVLKKNELTIIPL